MGIVYYDLENRKLIYKMLISQYFTHKLFNQNL